MAMSFEIPQSHEYGIQHRNIAPNEEPHRQHFTKYEAENWIEDWEELSPDHKDMWYIVKRPIGTWRRA
jgi:hypothetical protein